MNEKDARAQLSTMDVPTDETGFPVFEKNGSPDWHELLNLAYALCAKLADLQAHNADPNAHGGLDMSAVLADYAKLDHGHTVDDVEGLKLLLEEYRDQIAQLQDLISGDMPGAVIHNVDLSTLDGVTIRDGVWNKDRRTIEA